MKPLFRTIALSALLLAGFAASGIAQEEPRRAQPRERAPRSEPAPQAAPPPARQAPPQRQNSGGGGGARSRGTDDVGRVRAPRDQGGEDRAEYGVARRAPRERDANRAPEAPEAPPATASTAPAGESESRERAGLSSGLSSSEGEQDRRRAVPRGSRPRGDNPAVGRAEPRDGRSYPRDGRARDGRSYPGGRGGSGVYTSRGRVYNNYYYYYPRRWYPYGYGAFGGLGYFYYDPYTWYSYDPYWSRPHQYHYYSSSRQYGDYYYDTGELRLQVHPRHAEVYVDGYFAGHVDDFDGMFQGLRLEEGPYKIEIVAPGYETLVFDVRIIPGRKTSFRGELRPRP